MKPIPHRYGGITVLMIDVNGLSASLKRFKTIKQLRIHCLPDTHKIQAHRNVESKSIIQKKKKKKLKKGLKIYAKIQNKENWFNISS
jgi:hypothetical protein